MGISVVEWISEAPSVRAIVEKATAVIKEAKLDGKITGEEYGKVLAAIGPDLGKLIDELIVAAKD